MKTLVNFAKEHGFDHTNVTAEEREDGIGTVVGSNYGKGIVWYSARQMVAETGHELKVSTGQIKAKNRKDAEAQIIDQMKQAGVIAAEITKCFEYAPQKFNVIVNYVK